MTHLTKRQIMVTAAVLALILPGYVAVPRPTRGAGDADEERIHGFAQFQQQALEVWRRANAYEVVYVQSNDPWMNTLHIARN